MHKEVTEWRDWEPKCVGPCWLGLFLGLLSDGESNRIIARLPLCLYRCILCIIPSLEKIYIN